MSDKLVNNDEEFEVIKDEGGRKPKDSESGKGKRGGCGCWWIPALVVLAIFILIASQVLGIFGQVLGGGEAIVVTGTITREFSHVMGGTEQHFLDIETGQPRFDSMLFQLAHLDQMARFTVGDRVTIEGRIITVIGREGVLIDKINLADG